MNKKELTAHLINQTGLSNSKAQEVINTVFKAIQDNLLKGEPIMLQGFGTFSVANRVERKGINPRTKESIIIPARRVVKFSASKAIELN